MQRATLADVAARADAAFAPSAGVRIGAEVEWLVFDRDDLTRRIDAADVARIASGQLPAGGTVTIEPGGQVELVTPPHDGPRRLIDAIDADTRVLAQRFFPRPFHVWLDHAEPPTIDDIDRHITTLFPPVRPRGYLEFRMLDALPAPGRAAAIATVWALMTNDDVGELALEAARALGDPWRLVHDQGIANTDMQAAVTQMLDASAGSVRSSDSRLADAVTAWSERPYPVRPDDLTSWILHAAEPTA